MQNPRTTLADSELQKGHAEKDQLGLPRPISGGFASVYKVICPNQTWAVRCFLKKYLDQQQRCDAISQQLIVSKFPFATHFHFLKNGIRIQGNWYPIMKMEWVKGESLIRFVEGNLGSPEKLLALGNDIVEISRVLNRAGVAHGDLQHGNILVANGKPKLIDYDGMFVPALKGKESHESGHPNYQLPRVSSDFGPNLDNFSVWVIYLSLKALSVRPSLWKQFQGGDECLLLRRKDFENPDQSPILGELKRLPEANIGRFVTAFQSYLSLSPLEVPFIDPELPTPRIVIDWFKDHLPDFDLEKLWEKIDQIPPPSAYFKILPSPAIAPQWPLSTNPPTKPTIPGILVSPPDFPKLKLGPAIFYPTLVPMGLFQKSLGYGSLIVLVIYSLLWLAGDANREANIFIGGSIVLGIFYGILEYIRRKEYNPNSEYEQERKQRKALKREHIDRCKKDLKEKQDKAQRKFDEAKANWTVEIKPYHIEAYHRREALELAKKYLHLAKQQWKAASETTIRQFEKKKAELFQFKEEYTNVKNQKASEWSNLLTSTRNAQLNSHLKQHELSVAAIPGIGSVRKSILKANGFRTAFDVDRDRVLLLPRFGWELTQSIMEWRQNVEASFMFNKTSAIPPHEKQAFDSKYESRLKIIQQQLIVGKNELEKIDQNEENRLAQLRQQIEDCLTKLCQAEADLTVIPEGL